MEQPTWDDPAAGGVMVRGALWLMQVVGEGNTFTKNQLREAFPGVAQADRRIRDLRKYGWIVYASSEDATLSREDQRFVRAGVPVWDPKARRANGPARGASAKERQAALQRDGYMCTICGIMGGEPYPDDPVMTGVLTVSARLSNGGGPEGKQLVTECKRCRAGGAPALLDIDSVIALARDLDRRELQRLIRWVEHDAREPTELDRAWAACRRLAGDQRGSLVQALRHLR